MIDPYMSVKEVSAAVKLSPSEIRRRIKAKRFPKPIKLGTHRNSRIVWRRSWIIE
jgi:predicted DNA-binding transcriptional regulator AlpA